MRSIIFLLLTFCTFVCASSKPSNPKEDITLVVSGTAENQQEATLVALRSALEQTYGTFVSSNTKILNDEVISDEIVSVSKGNVKKYEVIDVRQINDGTCSVTLNVTICLSKLVSYANSKGVVAEFDGNSFATDLKIMELREKNTLDAFKHMCAEIVELSKDAFDFRITMKNPVCGNYIDRQRRKTNEEGFLINIKIDACANQTTSRIYSLVNQTIKSLKLQPEEILLYARLRRELYNYTTNEFYIPDSLMYVYETASKDERFWIERFTERYRYDRNFAHVLLPIHNHVIYNHIAWATEALFNALFNYKLKDLSNSGYYLSWEKEWHYLGIHKTLGARMEFKIVDSYNRYIGHYNGYDGPKYSTIKITFPHQPRRERDWDKEPLPVYNFFSHRWDSDSSFTSWLVKENKNDKKKKKKNTDKVDDSFGNLLYGISFDVFMTKETISQFKGFFIERNF